MRLAKRTPLAYYARYFDTVEVNASFYRTPTASTTTTWLDLTERSGDSAPFLSNERFGARGSSSCRWRDLRLRTHTGTRGCA